MRVSCNLATNINLRLTTLPFTFAPVQKIFAFIMAVLVLSFSTIPCSDDAPFGNEDGGHYSLTESSEQEEPHEDACSPFCICTCCAGFSITGTSTALFFFTLPFKIDYSSLNEAGIFTVASTIWQPPRAA